MELVDAIGVETAPGSEPPFSPGSPAEQDVIHEISVQLLSEDAKDRETGARFLREGITAREGQHFAQLVVYGDVVPSIAKLLDGAACEEDEEVELMCILTSLAEMPEALAVLVDRHQIVPLLVRVADRAAGKLAEQVAWMFGQIARESSARESSARRDTVLECGGLRATLRILHAAGGAAAPVALRRTATWALGVLCDGHPGHGFEVPPVLDAFAALLQDEDEAVLSQVCWGLSHICDGPTSHIRLVVAARLCLRLVQLLSHPSGAVSKPALRTVGNIVCAEDDQDYTQHIVDCNAVPSLAALVTHPSREIQKEACWTLSNISAGTVPQIQTVISSGAIPPLVALACDPGTDPDVRGEACWVLLNAASCGSDAQIAFLVKQGCARVLVGLLRDPNMVMMALEGIEKILAAGDEIADATRDTNPYADAIDAAAVAALCRSGTAVATPAAKKAHRVWTTYYVTCALCNGAFSKRAGDTRWCTECKCFVCGGCNCTVYHLTYQSELWREEAEEESAAMKQKRAAKRNKRARKRKRIKQKKALQRRIRLAREAGDERALDAARDALAALQLGSNDDDDEEDDADEHEDADADPDADADASGDGDAARSTRCRAAPGKACTGDPPASATRSRRGAEAPGGDAEAPHATKAVRPRAGGGRGRGHGHGHAPEAARGSVARPGGGVSGGGAARAPAVAAPGGANADGPSTRSGRRHGEPSDRRNPKGLSPPGSASEDAGRRRRASLSSPTSSLEIPGLRASARDESPGTDSTVGTLYAPADDSMRKNDELVDFLTQTGSILALAQMLDDDAA